MQDVPDAPAYGNAVVVELLEKWLNVAKEGKLNHVTITACQQPNLLATDYAGSIDMQYYVNEAIDVLRKDINEECDARLPPYDSSLSADYVCYNLAYGVISYDFV